MCRNCLLRPPLPPPPHHCLEPSQPLASSSGLGGEEAVGSRCWQRFRLSAKPRPLLLPFEPPTRSGLAWLVPLSCSQGTPWPGSHGFGQYLGAEHMPATGLRHSRCSTENKAGDTLLLEQGGASHIAQVRLLKMIPSSLARRWGRFP